MIDLLKAVTQFPHLNAPSYTSILGTKNKGSWVQSGVGLLTERGYIDRDVEGGYVPTDSGLEFLSEILGLDSYSTQRMFGWPNRNKKYVFQKDHDKLVTQFMLQLKRSGTLIAWEFSYVQKMYYVSLPPYYNKVKKITIVPDSTAILRIPGAKAVEVWVEMDRNTKRGAGFVRKIEKYFLACYGNTADQSVPPLLYIIESSNGATRRLKSVLKRFSELSEKYPNAPLIVLLTTVSAIETQPGVPIVSKKIWYVFIKGEIMDTPLSIEDTLGRISQNRTDIGKGICTL